MWRFFVLLGFFSFLLNEIIKSQVIQTFLWAVLISKPAVARVLQGHVMGGWKGSQRGLRHARRNFRGRENVFLNAVWVQSCSTKPAPAFVAGDTVKGKEAKCINQGSVLILLFLMVSCFRRVWLCHQHNAKDKASKISKSFLCTLFFPPLSNLRYGQCITVPKRAP